MTRSNPDADRPLEDVAEVARRLEVALSAADEAGRRTLDYFQRENYEVQRKADNSPVTAADREAELILRGRIHDAFPDDGILGEEFGEEPGTSGFRWILDPIDGTKSFICGVPLYGTLIGVERDQRTVLGLIRIPALDECVYASRGQGAWYVRGESPPRPAHVSSCPQLSDGVFLTSQVDGFQKRGASEAFLRLQAKARITRTWGDCYGYLLVATGRAELMIDPIMNLWDAAALQPILEEAGGSLTDWRGSATIYAGEVVATNPQILPEVLAITREYSPRTSA